MKLQKNGFSCKYDPNSIIFKTKKTKFYIGEMKLQKNGFRSKMNYYKIHKKSTTFLQQVEELVCVSTG